MKNDFVELELIYHHETPWAVLVSADEGKKPIWLKKRWTQDMDEERHCCRPFHLKVREDIAQSEGLI